MTLMADLDLTCSGLKNAEVKCWEFQYFYKNNTEIKKKNQWTDHMFLFLVWLNETKNRKKKKKIKKEILALP